MKIAFLCGSLEPGRDGVGDYVRQLALELDLQGQKSIAIALNDHYVTEVVVLYLLAKETLPILRIPAKLSTYRRFQQAYQWLEEFQPDWISIQFVPYSFHSKGIPITLGRNLKRLIYNRQVHLMMHESWIGNELGTSIKQKLVSYLQKKVVKQFINYIHPSVIHTHLPIYRTRLQRLGWHALPLPLFSNIPVIYEIPSASEIKETFQIGIFSQIDITKSFIDFLTSFIVQFSQQFQNCEVQILLIGGESIKMNTIKSILETIPGLRRQVHYTGFLAPDKLSNALQSCQLGITSVPRSGLGKSGSVAAFLAHGIPVAAPHIHPEALSTDIGFFSTDLCSAILIHPDNIAYQHAKLAANEAKNIIQLSIITRTFLSDILAVHN